MKSIKSQKAFYIAISILIAVVFWLYVDNTGSSERDVRLYNVPITLVGATDQLAERGLMVVSGDDATIDLRLQGRRQVISKINKNNIQVKVDVRNIMSTGTHTLNYTISYPNSVSQNSVTVVSASIYNVTVEIAELHSKEIQIITDVKGSVQDGYMMHECVVTPEVLTISGQKEDVEKIDHALVEVTLNNAAAPYSEYRTYKLIDNQGKVVNNSRLRCDEEKVRVEIPVVVLKELLLDVEFIETNGSRKENISYTITPPAITVSGEENILEELDTMTVAKIDLSDVMGDDTLEYEIILPGGCVNESGRDTATVEIKFNNDMLTKSVVSSNISFVHVPEGYSARAVTQAVNVTLRGTKDELENVTEQNVRIVVDLSGVSSSGGTYTAKGKVYVDGTENTGAIGTYQIGYSLKRS